MKKQFLTIFALLFLSAGYWGCTRENSGVKSIEQLQRQNGVPVQIAIVKPKPFTREYTFYAILSGIKETTASAMIADKVDKIYYHVGDYVQKDAVVVSFPTDNPAAKYFQAKVAYEHASATLQRMENLYQDGGISLQELENTRTQFRVTKANWEAVKKTVKVKAPISGRITRINVQEADNVNPGMPLFTISQTQKLKAKLWIAENQIDDFQVGNHATANWHGITITGRVTQVDLSLNPKKQAFGVVLEFDNHDKKIMSGVNAEIKVYAAGSKNAIIIDRKNLIKKDHQNFVFVVKNGRAEQRLIQPGRLAGLDVEIISGLNPGDSLVTRGQFLLEDGARVKVID